MSNDDPCRFLIAIGTTRYAFMEELDRPELLKSVNQVVDALTNNFKYRLVPGFGLNPSRGQLKESLDLFFASPERTSKDVVVVYYTGHAEVVDDEYIILLENTRPNAIKRTGLRAAELADWVLDDTPVSQVLLILDTCQAGAGATQLAERAFGPLRQRTTSQDGVDLSVIAASRPREYAEACAFTESLVRTLSSDAIGRHAPEFLSIDALVEIINSDSTPSWQTAQHVGVREGISVFFPNPRYDPGIEGLDLLTQSLIRHRALRAQEMNSHFLLRARGLDVPTDLWLFTGRRAVLRTMSRWLGEDRSPSKVRVVTGGPGSGKSAILGRLAVLADQELRPRVPDIHRLPADSIPPIGSMPEPIFARGLTPEGVLNAISAVVRVSANSPEELLRRLRQKPIDPIVVTIDAVDEAVRPEAVIDEVLVPLIRGLERCPLRLLLGVRRHLLRRFERGSLDIVDLEDDAYSDPDSVRDYAYRCLTELSLASPYKNERSVAMDVASAVAEAASQSFLVALITARSLAARLTTANPHDKAWRESLPREAAEAMKKDLDERLGADAVKARQLMSPLAFAVGDGLPWEDIWAALASVMNDNTYTDGDLEWLTSVASGYIVESRIEDRSVYRIYHEALAEDIRSGYEPALVNRLFAQAMLDRVPQNSTGRVWEQASPYTLRYLATHASYSQAMYELLVDPKYLVAAERTGLLAAIALMESSDSTRTEMSQARAAADAYRLAVHHLRGKERSDHISYLELAANQQRARFLAANIRRLEISRSWAIPWARWRPQPPNRLLGKHAGPISAMTSGLINRRPVVVTAGTERVIKIWDVATGLAQNLELDIGFVDRLSLATYRGRPVLAAVTVVRERVGAERTAKDADRVIAAPRPPERYRARRQAYVTVWDIVAGNMIADLFAEGVDVTRGMVLASVDDKLVLFGARPGRTLWARDVLQDRIYDGGPARQGLTDKTMLVAVYQDRPVAVLVNEDQNARVWDLERKVSLGTTRLGETFEGRMVGVASLEGVPILLTIREDSVQVWPLELDANPISVRTRNGAPLTGADVAIGGDRHLLVTASSEGLLEVFDLLEAKPVGPPLADHRGEIFAIAALDLDGVPTCLTVGRDRAVRAWDLTVSGRGPASWSSIADSVRKLAVTRVDGSELVLGATDSDRLGRWNAATGRERVTWTTNLAGIWDIAVGPVAENVPVILGSLAKSVDAIDARTGSLVGRLHAHGLGWVTAVTIGRHQRRPVIVVSDEEGRLFGLTPVSETVFAVRASHPPDSPVLIRAIACGESDLWFVATKMGRATVRGIGGKRVLFHLIPPISARVSACAIDNKGQNLYVAWENRIGRYALSRQRRFLRPRRVVPTFDMSLEDKIAAMVFDERSGRLIVGSEGAIDVRRRDLSLERRIYVGAIVRDVAIVDNGSIVVATEMGLVCISLDRSLGGP